MPIEPKLAVVKPATTSIFAGVKESSWRFIVLFTALVFGVIIAINKTAAEEHSLAVSIENATAHLVTPTLLGAGFLSIVVVVCLIVYGKLSFRDFGWKWENLVPGLAATAVLWIAMQMIEVVANFAGNGRFELSSGWTGVGIATSAGVLIGQVFGTAVSEETFFRGFLLPQLRLKFSRMRVPVAIGLAIVVSQLAFALFHVPNLVLGVGGKVGTGFVDVTTQLALDFAIGLVFAAVYIRTGNLFLVMGVHALQNAGTSLVATPIDPAQVMLVLAIIVFLGTFAPPLVRRFRRTQPAPRPMKPLGS